MLTKITRDHFAGVTNPTERDLTDNRKLNSRKKNRANNTKAPRTRDGKNFPGGRILRRRLKNLSVRQNSVASGERKPGAMK